MITEYQELDQVSIDIKHIADLFANKTQEEIIDLFYKNGYSHDTLFLLVKAAEMLYKDRINFVPPKPLFKRVV